MSTTLFIHFTLLGIVSLFAMLLQIAVQRDPGIQEPEIVQVSRRIKIGAWAIVTGYCWYTLLGEDLVVYPSVLLFSASVLALSDMFTAASRLFNLIEVSTVSEKLVEEYEGASNLLQVDFGSKSKVNRQRN